MINGTPTKENRIMSIIPTSVTDTQLSQSRRGYVCKIRLVEVFNLILYRLHTGCQWRQLPTRGLSRQAVYYHFQKWSRDGSLEQVWQYSIQCIREELNLTQLNRDGSHSLAKKGGESVAYQRRKRAKTSNILPITEGNGYVLATTGIIAGNHHDAFHLKPHLQAAFKAIKRLGLSIAGAFFNADSAFDTRAARATCFNHHLFPILLKILVTARVPNVDANASSTSTFTNAVSLWNVLLPGWTSFERS